MRKPVAAKRPERDRLLPAISERLAELSDGDLQATDAWSALDQLSEHTEVELLDADSASIVIFPGNTFEVAGTAHVTLNFGKRDDAVRMPESFPMTIRGHLASDGKVVLSSIDVDTSAFYA